MNDRLITQKQKIINALRLAGSEGVTNAELSKISLRYGGHLGNLYRQGYKILKYNLDGGLYKYVLIAEPADYKYFKNAQEEILEAMAEKHTEEVAKDLEEMLDEKYFHIIRKSGWYQQQLY
jgi:RNA binding exosome subunit